MSIYLSIRVNSNLRPRGHLSNRDRPPFARSAPCVDEHLQQVTWLGRVACAPKEKGPSRVPFHPSRCGLTWCCRPCVPACPAVRRVRRFAHGGGAVEGVGAGARPGSNAGSQPSGPLPTPWLHFDFDFPPLSSRHRIAKATSVTSLQPSPGLPVKVSTGGCRRMTGSLQMIARPRE